MKTRFGGSIALTSGKITSEFRPPGNPIQEDTGVAMNASRQRPNAGGELPPARAADPPKVSQVPKGRGRKPEIAGKDEDSIEEGRAYPSLCN
ncbi:hypothetical protein EJB05_49139, partial [Eragrostis curvula]